MDIRQLKYFVTCAEQKSFSAAAELLYTSQPHVSMVVNSLEKELGARLFERTAKGVILTEAGSRSYELAVNILKNMQLMQETSPSSVSGHLTILTNASSNMAALFSSFYEAHPDNNFRYLEAGVETILDKIALHEAEIGFVFIPSNKLTALGSALKRKHLCFSVLEQSDLVVYVGPESPLFQTESLSVSDLSDLKFIQQIEDYYCFSDLLGNEYADGKTPVFSGNLIETNSSHCIIQMLRTTDLCNLCSFWLKSRFRSYDFHMIPVEGLKNKILFGYISNAEDQLSPLTSEFLSYVRNVIKEEQETD